MDVMMCVVTDLIMRGVGEVSHGILQAYLTQALLER
jgi:hypothetical protein